ncbi:tRNA pseudouridine55 synthase [Anaerotaenia torta]|uniref:tRNA pseudouridine(55) synthase TruB n=1 Tax=Anaerotaenia torta TaxID=433293 RepID=UPI003D1FFFD1
MDGIINICKEKGYTSHDVVAKMRGILRMKKIGHTGTLDPDAQGVLPVCVGKATKLVDLITDKDKTYLAQAKLGITTDTQDISGKVLSTSEVKADRGMLERALQSFTGEYMQLPPMYSAIKVNGRKLYELAREGKEIERDRRPVTVKEIRLLEYNETEQEFTVSVECTKGTYVRTLLQDIGDSLGCGATMTSLVRTAVGSFRLENAITLSQLERLAEEKGLEPYIVTIDQVFCHYSRVTVFSEYNKLIYNGNLFKPEHVRTPGAGRMSELVRVYDSEEQFIGLYRYEEEEKLFRPVKMFLTQE